MNREKYVHNQDYRDGYDEGFENGRKQMKKQIESMSNEIKKILSIFQDEESEEKVWRK